ncbi:MAG: O-succinylbenzoate synthase, partial [uncultured Acidimicrobiales bacterium]
DDVDAAPGAPAAPPAAGRLAPQKRRPAEWTGGMGRVVAASGISIGPRGVPARSRGGRHRALAGGCALPREGQRTDPRRHAGHGRRPCVRAGRRQGQGRRRRRLCRCRPGGCRTRRHRSPRPAPDRRQRRLGRRQGSLDDQPSGPVRPRAGGAARRLPRGPGNGAASGDGARGGRRMRARRGRRPPPGGPRRGRRARGQGAAPGRHRHDPRGGRGSRRPGHRLLDVRDVGRAGVRPGPGGRARRAPVRVRTGDGGPVRRRRGGRPPPAGRRMADGPPARARARPAGPLRGGRV